MGYSFRLTARVLLYAPSHRQDSTYHSLCYTVVEHWLEREIAQWVHHEGSIRRPMSERSYHGATSRSIYIYKMISKDDNIIKWYNDNTAEKTLRWIKYEKEIILKPTVTSLFLGCLPQCTLDEAFGRGFVQFGRVRFLLDLGDTLHVASDSFL